MGYLIHENPARRRKRRTPPRTKSGRFRKGGGSRRRRSAPKRRRATGTRRRRSSTPRRSTRRRRNPCRNPRGLGGIFGRGADSLMGSGARATTMFAAQWLNHFLGRIARERIPFMAQVPDWIQPIIFGLGSAWLLRSRFMPRAVRQLARPVQDMAILQAIELATFNVIPTGYEMAGRIGLSGGGYADADYRGGHSMGDWMTRSGLQGYETVESIGGTPPWAGAYRMN